MEKKYTAQEAAINVLKSVQELIDESFLGKNNTAHEIEDGLPPESNDAEEVAEEHGEVESTEHEKKNSKEGKDGHRKNDCLAGCGKGSKPASGESKEPPHEQNLEGEEHIMHDAKENAEDERDADKIEHDEEPEAKKKDKAFEKSYKDLITHFAKSDNNDFPRPQGVKDLYPENQVPSDNEKKAMDLKKKRMVKKCGVNKCGEVKTIGKGEIPPHDDHTKRPDKKLNAKDAQPEFENNPKVSSKKLRNFLIRRK